MKTLEKALFHIKLGWVSALRWLSLPYLNWLMKVGYGCLSLSNVGYMFGTKKALLYFFTSFLFLSISMIGRGI